MNCKRMCIEELSNYVLLVRPLLIPIYVYLLYKLKISDNKTAGKCKHIRIKKKLYSLILSKHFSSYIVEPYI